MIPLNLVGRDKDGNIIIDDPVDHMTGDTIFPFDRDIASQPWKHFCKFLYKFSNPSEYNKYMEKWYTYWLSRKVYYHATMGLNLIQQTGFNPFDYFEPLTWSNDHAARVACARTEVRQKNLIFKKTLEMEKVASNPKAHHVETLCEFNNYLEYNGAMFYRYASWEMQGIEGANPDEFVPTTSQKAFDTLRGQICPRETKRRTPEEFASIFGAEVKEPDRTIPDSALQTGAVTGTWTAPDGGFIEVEQPLPEKPEEGAGAEEAEVPMATWKKVAIGLAVAGVVGLVGMKLLAPKKKGKKKRR